jgi:hypothetical protein
MWLRSPNPLDGRFQFSLTANTREFSESKALNAGFDRFLVKLENLESIEGVIVELLSSRDYMD